MIKLNAIDSKPAATSETFNASINYAREIVSAANLQRLEIIQQARNEATLLQQQAYEIGYRQALQSAASSITAFVEREKHRLFGSNETILSLALRIAQDVTLTAVQLDRPSLLKRIDRALGLLAAREHLTVAVNPADLELVKEQTETILLKTNVAKLQVVQDPNLAIGEARLETNSATIQVNPLEHLERYRQTLLPQSNEA